MEFVLTYSGGLADEARIGFYDVAQALIGFERSLAITTHFILNGEVITQATSLKGAEIIAVPATDGSWKFTAIVCSSIFALGTAPKDTPVGHLISSAYDYVVNETLGFRVDYEKTLGRQIDEMKKKDDRFRSFDEGRFDSVIEKCERAISEMHRPIVKSETAFQAQIHAGRAQSQEKIGPRLTQSTFEYVNFTERSPRPKTYSGRVTSYNINTFKGRVYVPEYQRPIPFQLAEAARDATSVRRIVRSLADSARNRRGLGGEITFEAFENLSRTERLKSFFIISVISQKDEF